MLSSALVVAVSLLTLGCSVDGQAEAGGGDLSSRAVAPSEFPTGTATRVPQPAVPAALADLTGRPLHGVVSPAECTPTAVPSAGAVILVGPDPSDSAATFTSAVVHADDELDDVTDLARRCPHVTSGSAPTATSAVSTQVIPPPQQGSVTTAALRRQSSTGGTGPSALTTGTTTLMAQRGGVRVIVEYRHQGAGAMSATAAVHLNALFESAVESAFG